jgi:hypothetical protein
MAKTQVEVIHRLTAGELDLLMTIGGSRTTADLRAAGARRV